MNLRDHAAHAADVEAGGTNTKAPSSWLCLELADGRQLRGRSRQPPDPEEEVRGNEQGHACHGDSTENVGVCDCVCVRVRPRMCVPLRVHACEIHDQAGTSSRRQRGFKLSLGSSTERPVLGRTRNLPIHSYAC